MARPAFRVTYVLDTNAIIYHLRGASEMGPVFDAIQEARVEPIISVITRIELLGFPRLARSEETAIKGLLAGFRERDVDSEIACSAIDLRRKYRLGVPDCIVAATAIVEHAQLVTRDEQMGRVRGLQLPNPFANRRGT